MDQKWSRPANWLEGVVPANGDRVVIRSGATVNDLAGLTLDGVEFNASEYAGIAGNPFTISGSNAVVINGPWPLARIEPPVRFTAANPTINAISSAPTLEMFRLTLAGGTLNVTGPAHIRFGPIDEEGPASLRLSGQEIVLNGPNSITGTIEVNAGLVRVMTASAFGSSGSGTIVGPDGALAVEVFGDCAEPITVNGGAIGSSFPMRCPLNISGTVRFSGDFNTPISGSGRMRIPNSVFVTLWNPGSTFTGGVELDYQATLTLVAPEVIPDASEVTMRSQYSRLQLLSSPETIRRLDCGGEAQVVIRPGAGQLRVLEPSSVAGCRLDFYPRDITWPEGEITLLRNDSGSPIRGDFVDYREGTALMGHVLTYAGGAGFDVSLLPPYGVGRREVLSMESIIAVNQTSTGLMRMRIFDQAGNPLPNARMSFVVLEPACGSFGGQPRAYSRSDSQGVAQSPPFTASPPGNVVCFIESRVDGGGVTAALTVYDPATLAIGMVPAQLVVQPGATLELAADVRAGQSNLNLLGLAVSWEVQSESGGASAQLAASTSLTGTEPYPNQNRARMSAVANGMEGSYLVRARVGPAVGTLRVQQGSAPPPATRSTRLIAPDGKPITLNVFTTESACVISRAQVIDPRAALFTPEGAPPAALAFPHGWLDFRLDNCGTGQPLSVVVEYPDPLPPTATYWKNGPTPDNRTPHWYPMPGRIDGNRFTFTITDGGLGDDDLTANGSITDMGGLAFNGGTLQDLWWSGTAENGWGMSIIQHGDMLFANVYVYDSAGRPMWLVIPGGAWNAAHTAFTGALYIPHGSPFYAYDVSRFNIGTAVGTATFTFSGENNAVFDYTINGVAGRKNITRLAFGRPETLGASALGDLWWGGVAQNGWGITVLQQLRTLFSLWYTYDASGAPTWYVMPGGEWTSSETYEGRIYRAVGSAWVGATYDPGQHRTIDLGSYRLRFAGGSATLEYTIDGRSGSVPLTRLGF